jgi:hypothetical protein
MAAHEQVWVKVDAPVDEGVAEIVSLLNTAEGLVLTMNWARPVFMFATTSLATQPPPSSRNMVRLTPGSSFMSLTDASVTQPL